MIYLPKNEEMHIDQAFPRFLDMKFKVLLLILNQEMNILNYSYILFLLLQQLNNILLRNWFAK
jgi:hypothetical protein